MSSRICDGGFCGWFRSRFRFRLGGVAVLRATPSAFIRAATSGGTLIWRTGIGVTVTGKLSGIWITALRILIEPWNSASADRSPDMVRSLSAWTVARSLETSSALLVWIRISTGRLPRGPRVTLPLPLMVPPPGVFADRLVRRKLSPAPVTVASIFCSRTPYSEFW